MALFIDTSILIELEKNKAEIIEQLNDLRKSHPSNPKISFVSSFEFIFGLRNKSPKNKEKALAFLNEFETVHTTDLTVKNLIFLKENYELPLADLLIASQVMESRDILITKDKDFEMIAEIEKVIL